MANGPHRVHRSGARTGASSSVARFGLRRGAERIMLTGELRMSDASAIWRELRAAIMTPPAGPLDLDLSGVTLVDGAIMALLVDVRAELAERRRPCSLVGAPEALAPLVRVYGGDSPVELAPRPPHPGVMAALGEAVVDGAATVRRLFAFVGDLLWATGGVVRWPSTGNWRALPELVARAGADGVPIVLLLNFLVGLVMAYQSADQLRLYGANIFVADVVGISLTRELVPLMTAIIVSGRSGAAFAAEIGAMKVSEELDALRTMGLEPARYLALPRILSLALVTPVLTLLGDVVGLAGGAVVGAASLDVGPAAYLAELRTAVFPRDVLGGLLKSVGFGLAIAVIGCQQGFLTTGGAAGVGRRTTATVVLCLFTIVVIDTLFTMLFRMVGV